MSEIIHSNDLYKYIKDRKSVSQEIDYTSIFKKYHIDICKKLQEILFSKIDRNLIDKDNNLKLWCFGIEFRDIFKNENIVFNEHYEYQLGEYLHNILISNGYISNLTTVLNTAITLDVQVINTSIELVKKVLQ